MLCNLHRCSIKKHVSTIIAEFVCNWVFNTLSLEITLSDARSPYALLTNVIYAACETAVNLTVWAPL